MNDCRQIQEVRIFRCLVHLLFHVMLKIPRHKFVLSPFVAIIHISPDWASPSKKSEWLFIWVVVVVMVVVVVCTRRLGTKTKCQQLK